MDDSSPRVRQVAREQYLDRVLGKSNQPVSVTGLGPDPVQINVAAIVAAVREEESDPDVQLRIARRILGLGQQLEDNGDGRGNGSGIADSA